MLQATLRYGLRTTTEIDVGNRDEFIRRCLETIEFVQKLDVRLKGVVVALYVKGFKGIYGKLCTLPSILCLAFKLRTVKSHFAGLLYCEHCCRAFHQETLVSLKFFGSSD